jgi:isochorismate pyruvate lyase
MEADSLDEVRQNIDFIDQQIVQLLGERHFYIKQAAKFKTSPGDVKAPARVEIVIAKVRNVAIQNDIDADMVETIYRTMIDCFIKSELKEFEKQIE